MLQKEIMQRDDYAAFEYKHGNPEIIKVISEVGDETLAMKRADTLLEFHKGMQPIEANPSTKIHLLVKDLQEWIRYFSYQPA